jgi:hypothetical protein
MIDWHIVAGLAAVAVFIARGIPCLGFGSYKNAEEYERYQRRRFEETCERVRKQAAERNYR